MDVPWLWGAISPGDGEDTQTFRLDGLTSYSMTSSLTRNWFTVEVFNWHNRLATHSLNYMNNSPHFGRGCPCALCGYSESLDVILVCGDSSFSQTIPPSYI